MPAYSGLVASPLYDVEESPHHGVPEFKGQGRMATIAPFDYQK
ncbi:MAG: hypothetical protein PHT62_00355 [Desulfotomaculaceae bacterium]|nr:hypothetical protein [Desulfotomaculaceae bacterium]